MDVWRRRSVGPTQPVQSELQPVIALFKEKQPPVYLSQLVCITFSHFQPTRAVVLSGKAQIRRLFGTCGATRSLTDKDRIESPRNKVKHLKKVKEEEVETQPRLPMCKYAIM